MVTRTTRNPDLALCFGECVRELRLKRGIPQETLALHAELDRSYMGRVERGERQPSLDMVFRVAAGLEMKPETLIAAVARRWATMSKG
jgi:XRE family transcriptional regulator, regulator of sulfur utilization